jgi:fibronectin type 3 domain-containing protein
MHYNFHDNPEPWPEAGVIYLVRVNTIPSPANFFFDVVDGELLLTWDAPDNGDSPIDVLLGYNVFSSYEQGEYELLAFTEETSFLVENGATAGLNSYYVTAVYEEEESEPSDQLFILFDTPEPDTLLGEPQENKVVLEWSLPDPESDPMATLLGYNIYHKYENEDFAILEFTETINFTHEELDNGTHHYYVTAVYEGGESDPSNEIEVTVMVATSLNEIHFASFNLYPNPARDHVFIDGMEDIKNIRIFNQAGQTIKLIGVTGINRKIDISDLSTGLYVITIETSNGKISKRFIVQ